MSRQVISFESIAGLIRAQMSLTPECSGCHCGPVKWRPPDGDGCNWILSRLEGPYSLGCLDRLVPLLTDLRGNFNVPEPRLHAAGAVRPRVFRTSVPVEALPDALDLRKTDELVNAARAAVRDSRTMLLSFRATSVDTRRRCREASDAVSSAWSILERRRSRTRAAATFALEDARPDDRPSAIRRPGGCRA